MQYFLAADFSGSANSLFMYILGIGIFLFICIISLRFLIHAYREGLARGMDKKTMNRVIRSSALFSLVPSAAILVGLVTMVGKLGAPLSWIRLSVIGAVHYELLAAQSAGVAAGLKDTFGVVDLNASTFASIAVVMTICILAGPIFNFFFLKRYMGRLSVVSQKDNRWGRILVSSMFIGMVVKFMCDTLLSMRESSIDSTAYFAKNGFSGYVPVLVMLVSLLSMFVCDRLSKKEKLKWLDGFSLPVSMILGMTAAVLIAQGGTV